MTQSEWVSGIPYSGTPSSVEYVPERPADSIFPGRREAIASGRCMAPPIGCGGEVDGFDDVLSKQEYGISGLCQECQDSLFGHENEEYDDCGCPVTCAECKRDAEPF